MRCEPSPVLAKPLTTSCLLSGSNQMLFLSASYSSRVSQSFARSQSQGGSATCASQSKVGKFLVIGANFCTGIAAPPHWALSPEFPPARAGKRELVAYSVSSHTSGIALTPCRAKIASISFMSASEIDHPIAPTLSLTSRSLRHPTSAVLIIGFDSVQRSANCGSVLP